MPLLLKKMQLGIGVEVVPKTHRYGWHIEFAKKNDLDIEDDIFRCGAFPEWKVP